MLCLLVQSLADTHGVARAVAQLARTGDIIVLAGEMGAGKTAFAQSFGQTLGVSEPITSPTFTLVHTYDSGRMILHHADLYRLERMSEVADLALAELVEGDGILLVEWGDVVAAMLGDHLEIRLQPMENVNANARRITLQRVGRMWDARWARLETVLSPWRIEA